MERLPQQFAQPQFGKVKLVQKQYFQEFQTIVLSLAFKPSLGNQNQANQRRTSFIEQVGFKEVLKPFRRIDYQTISRKLDGSIEQVNLEFSEAYAIPEDLESQSVDEQEDDYYSEPTEQPMRSVSSNDRKIFKEYILRKKFNEFDLAYYLKNKRSSAYSNVISINFLARGGEAIVYRLEYFGKDEVVIKTTLIEENLGHDIQTQESYLRLFYETSQLKILQNKNFITQIKEEHLEYDFQKNLLCKYIVIVERAQYSLFDLFYIWKNKELSTSQFESYSHEKLAYYFFRTMQIMQYFHEKNVYYGDMKPQNLLVFKDQLVKVGDLGTSIKLSQFHGNDDKLYQLKGLSKSYASTQMIQDFHEQNKVSKHELFKYDQFSLRDQTKRIIRNTMRSL
eukprot:403343775